MLIELFKQEFKLFRSAHQAHLRYEFYVPKNCERLNVAFSYGLFDETNQAELKEVFKRDGVPTQLLGPNDAFRNLLTLSINDSMRFRGAHHWFNGHQEIMLSEDESSEGFVRGKIESGNWQVILSCHGIFSPYIEGELSVTAEVSQREAPYLEHPLYLKETDFVKKERNLLSSPVTFKKLELHAHTTHSDASQTTRELVTNAIEQGIDWVAITDHNTITAIPEALALSKDTSLKIIPGLEFTTFYGHYLMHGAPEYLFNNWTDVNRGNIDGYLEKLKRNPINITIAHPYSEGNPFCTGCRWDFELSTLRYVDSIEVWNKINPHLQPTNELAYELWQYLLQSGYEIAGSCGRDWHRPHGEQDIAAFTYLLVEEAAKLPEVLHALSLGRSYASWRVQVERFMINERYQIGDRIQAGTSELSIQIGLSGISLGDVINLWNQDEIIQRIEVTSETMEVFQTINIESQGHRLLRVDVRDKESALVMFTNPIYIG